MRLLKKYPDDALALIDKSALESAGIECCLFDQHVASVMPHINFASGGVRLMVAEEQYEEALELLRIDFSAEQSESEQLVCPECKSKDIETTLESRFFVSILCFVLVVFFVLPAGKKNYLEHYSCKDCKHTWRMNLGLIYIAGVIILILLSIIPAMYALEGLGII